MRQVPRRLLRRLQDAGPAVEQERRAGRLGQVGAVEPPARPNASPEPSTVTCMTRCASRVVEVERLLPSERGARTAVPAPLPAAPRSPIDSTFTRARAP